MRGRQKGSENITPLHPVTSAHTCFGQKPMWQEALWTRGRYLLEKSDGGEGAEGPESLGDGCPGFQGEVCVEDEKPQDWLYESYYRMSQQHPLIVFLLLIVMGTCLALLAVFFASGLVSENVCVLTVCVCAPAKIMVRVIFRGVTTLIRPERTR